MKKLKTFKSFIQEAKSYSGISSINIPQSVINYLDDLIGPRILAKFFGNENLKNITLEESDDLVGNPILVNWKDFTFRVPFLEYDPKRNITYLSDKRNSEVGKTLELLRERFVIDIKTWGINFTGVVEDYSKKSIIYQIFSDLVTSSRKEGNFLDVYSSDFKNTTEFKFLEKLGTKVASSPLQAKRGVLVLEIPNYFGGIAIYPNGYLRKLSERSQLLTNNPELNVPIYTMETLRKKLSYILEIVLKSHFKKFNIPSKEIATIIKQIGGNESAEYSEMARELVKKYPELVIVLPEPEGGFDADLKAGAKLLNRFGAFGS